MGHLTYRILLLAQLLVFKCSAFCSFPKDIAHGKLIIGDFWNGKVRVKCDEGFVAKPNATMLCDENIWSQVTCVRHCLNLTQPIHGHVTYHYISTSFTNVAIIHCDEGFGLEGESVLFCLVNGNWSGNDPVCKKLDCLSIDQRERFKNGLVQYQPPNSTTYRSKASFTCNDGFYLEKNITSTCMANGNWSKPVPVCNKYCRLPQGPENGNVQIIQSANVTTYQTGSQVLFSCKNGFQLRGNDTLKCLSNGHWNAMVPICERDGSVSATQGGNILFILGILIVVSAFTAAGIAVYLRKSGKICVSKRIENLELDHLNIEIKVWSSFRPSVISLREFPAYVEVLHKDGNKLFADGFRLLDEESPSLPTTVAESQACRAKTRFSNSLPFDDSRVLLMPIEEEEGSDFINANFIPEYNKTKKYIATQGPTPATKNDFWRMIWEYDVDMIVMLTKRLETGKGSLPRTYTAERHWVVPPCDQYWPDEVQGPVYYGKLIVNTLSESVMSDYVTRVIEIKLGEETRTVTQIHFMRWPEHGCPKRHWPFLNFVTMVRQYLPRQMVVHCSTGVGRTGTYIAIDRLLQHIKEHDSVDIYSVILDMRNYRCSMVKTLEQFMYVYECIKHFITLEEDQDDEEDDARQYAHTRQDKHCFNNHAFDEESA